MQASRIILATMLLTLTASAQTNVIVFMDLLSPSNAILMTNAEFRCFSGDTVFFRNAMGYKKFHAADLNTNVLATLGTSLEKLKANENMLADAETAKRKKITEAANEQRLIAAKRAEEVKKSWDRFAASNAARAHNSPGFENPPETTDNQGIGGTQ